MIQNQKIPQQFLPKSHTERLDWLRLSRSRRVGPATFLRLVGEHRGVQNALEILPQIALQSGVKSYQAASRTEAQREWDRAMALGLRPIFLGQADYPAMLGFSPDAPPFLWAKGRLELAQHNTVAIVGSRNSSSLGMRLTRKISHDLGQKGLVIVSGLARGIDTEAHRSALMTGTIAVYGGGLGVCYPSENQKLADQIADSGLVISEHPPDLAPQSRHFPQRNRIIAGMSLGVVVIEGALRSGSLITAKLAGDLGREVMAVPGSPLDPRASGTNALIRDGAVLIRSADDVLEAIESAFEHPQTPQPPLPLFGSEQAAQPGPNRPQKAKAPNLHDIAKKIGVANPIADLILRHQKGSRHEALSKLGEAEINGSFSRSAAGRMDKKRSAG